MSGMSQSHAVHSLDPCCIFVSGKGFPVVPLLFSIGPSFLCEHVQVIIKAAFVLWPY